VRVFEKSALRRMEENAGRISVRNIAYYRNRKNTASPLQRPLGECYLKK
jgi:hypothetical protein